MDLATYDMFLPNSIGTSWSNNTLMIVAINIYLSFTHYVVAYRTLQLFSTRKKTCPQIFLALRAKSILCMSRVTVNAKGGEPKQANGRIDRLARISIDTFRLH
ncbi:unnamed protein product [Ectocarpus sp. 12 AP-2014]